MSVEKTNINNEEVLIIRKNEHGYYDLRGLLDIIGIFIPNWFDREDFEGLADCELTDEQFKDICNSFLDCGISDETSDNIREWLNVNDRAIKIIEG